MQEFFAITGFSNPIHVEMTIARQETALTIHRFINGFLCLQDMIYRSLNKTASSELSRYFPAIFNILVVFFSHGLFSSPGKTPRVEFTNDLQIVDQSAR